MACIGLATIMRLYLFVFLSSAFLYYYVSIMEEESWVLFATVSPVPRTVCGPSTLNKYLVNK